MAGSIKIQHGGTASTPQAGFSTLWVRSSDGEFYYTKPDGTSESLVGENGATGAQGPTGSQGATGIGLGLNSKSGSHGGTGGYYLVSGSYRYDVIFDQPFTNADYTSSAFYNPNTTNPGAGFTTNIVIFNPTSSGFTVEVTGTPGANSLLQWSAIANGETGVPTQGPIGPTGATGPQGSTGPTGPTDPTSLKTPSVISGTLQSVQDAAGNISALRISTTSITNFGGGAVVQNTAFGTDALKFNTTGLGNVAIGQLALNSNTTGNGNTAIGQGAMNLNATGGANTAIGNGSLYYNTIGNSNTALGASALVGITTGSYNIGIGTSTGARGTASCTIGIGQSSSIFPGATGTIVIGNNSTGATGIQNAVVLGNGLSSVVPNTTHVQNLFLSTPLLEFSNNADAKTGGLIDGQIFRDNNGRIHIVFT
jgi:hypothetical protein